MSEISRREHTTSSANRHIIAAARSLAADAVRLAVFAHVRHTETDYDRMPARGSAHPGTGGGGGGSETLGGSMHQKQPPAKVATAVAAVSSELMSPVSARKASAAGSRSVARDYLLQGAWQLPAEAGADWVAAAARKILAAAELEVDLSSSVPAFHHNALRPAGCCRHREGPAMTRSLEPNQPKAEIYHERAGAKSSGRCDSGR